MAGFIAAPPLGPNGLYPEGLGAVPDMIADVNKMKTALGCFPKRDYLGVRPGENPECQGEGEGEGDDAPPDDAPPDDAPPDDEAPPDE